MKKFIFLPALLLTISSFASLPSENFNSLLIHKNTAPCLVTVSKTQTVSVICPVGQVLTAFVQVTGTGIDGTGDCTQAFNHANEDATFKLSQAVTAKQAELMASCPQP